MCIPNIRVHHSIYVYVCMYVVYVCIIHAYLNMYMCKQCIFAKWFIITSFCWRGAQALCFFFIHFFLVCLQSRTLTQLFNVCVCVCECIVESYYIQHARIQREYSEHDRIFFRYIQFRFHFDLQTGTHSIIYYKLMSNTFYGHTSFDAVFQIDARNICMFMYIC